MKKQICMILSLIIILASSVPYVVGFAAEEFATEFNLLSDLGIADVSGKASDTVSRGEFTQYISNTLNIVKMVPGYLMPYTDTDESHPYYEGIYNVYSWGAISDSEFFRPDDKILTNEAVKMVVASLGYDFLGKVKGGYPSGYIAAANQLKILPANLSEYITRKDMYSIIYNMLHCKLSDVILNGNAEADYTVMTSGTLLYERWNIDFMSGTVTDSQYFGMDNYSGAGEGNVGIDGYVLRNGGADTDSYFGEKVDVYYDRKDYTIRSIYRSEPTAKNVKNIFTSQSPLFSGNKYTYEDGDEIEEITLARDAVIVINNRRVNFDSSRMVPEHGSIKFVCTGSTADIVCISSFTQIVVGQTVATEYLVSDKLSVGRSYVLDDENIVFTDQNGDRAGFDAIGENSILWIADDDDGEITEVVICNDMVIGEYDGITSDSNLVYIDGRSFEMTDVAKKQLSDNFEMGSTIRGCINPDNVIVYFVSENETTSLKIGYLMYSGFFEQGIEKRINVKILDDTGKVREYVMADRFSVNGVRFTGSCQENYERLPKESYRPQSMISGIVQYVVSNDGKIASLNYPDYESLNLDGARGGGIYKTTEILDATDAYIQYKNSDRAVMCKGPSKIFVKNGEFTRFVVPVLNEKNPTADDDDYIVQKGFAEAGMPNQIQIGYTTVAGGLVSEYLVSKYVFGTSTDYVNENAYTEVVYGVSKMIDADGNETEKLSMLNSDGSISSYTCKEAGFLSGLNLGFGDLIKVSAGEDREVSAINIIYRAGDKTFVNECTSPTNYYTLTENNSVFTNNTGMGLMSRAYMIIGNVYKQDGNAIQVLPSWCEPGDYEYGIHTLYDFSLANKSVQIIDMRTQTTATAGAAVLKSYASFGNECSKVVVSSYYGTVTGVMVYID